MLLFPDFLSWCGSRLIAAAGPDRETQLGSALVETQPPAWREHTVQNARKLSWVAPACAPSGRLFAAAAGPDTQDAEFGVEHRSIWVLRANGARVRQLTSPLASYLTDEAPRFSRDGHWTLFVRSRVVPVDQSSDSIELVSTSGTGSVVPIINFTSNDYSYYDHFSWPEEIDWYQPVTASAHTATGVMARSVPAGRAYVGTVRRSRRRDINGGLGDPIDIDISHRGGTATVIAVYQPCRRPPVSYPELAFPDAKITGDQFEATHEFVEKSRSLYARITVTGIFVSGQRVEGTISSVTNVSARTGRPGGVCRTSNYWQASEGLRGFRVCAPHPLGDYGVAQDIYDDRARCPTVQHALKRSAFDPPTLPLAAAATFSTPGWSCHAIRIPTRSWQCLRAGQRFRFIVSS